MVRTSQIMSDEELDDESLADLRELKRKLLVEAVDLRREFIAWNNAEDKISGRKEKDFLPELNEFQDLITEDREVNHVSKKCVVVSSFMMGIKFNAVDRTWISEHKYLYTAMLKLKALEFILEVTVDAKEPTKGLEILKMVCQFVNPRQCYSLEIRSWVDRFTEAKDICNLFSAMSEYIEYNITRTKILKKFKDCNIAYAQECIEDDGGIMIFLHAKNDMDYVYFEIRWVLRFVDSLWQIDNFFIIQPISAGAEFLQTNNQLLQSFCKCKIKRDDLQNLWDELCSAVAQDEPSQSTTGTHTS